MARKIAAKRPAKRANRPNPREDRNNMFNDDAPEFLTGKKRKSRYGETREDNVETVNYKSKRVELIPRNLAQEEYIAALEDETKTVVVAVGPAGTGKTYLAIQYAVSQLQAGEIDKIILIRPVITSDGSNLGALPGGILEKMAPYLGETLSLLKDIYSTKVLTKMFEDEIIEILPLAVARGRSLRKSFVIVEEAQNIEAHTMKLLLTRIGEGTRMLINGDMKQADRGFMVENGLRDFLRKLDQAGGSSHFAVCSFNKCDIERHPVVGEALRIYGEDDI